MVFDSRPRTYQGPREHGESQFVFLDRSGRPPFEAARRRIDDWYSRLCDGLKEGVRQRLRGEDDQHFDVAFWELYLHELFTRLGYEISCEPTLPNGRKIDFLLRRGDAAFYLEATAAGVSDEQRVPMPAATASTVNSTRSGQLPSGWASASTRPAPAMHRDWQGCGTTWKHGWTALTRMR